MQEIFTDLEAHSCRMEALNVMPSEPSDEYNAWAAFDYLSYVLTQPQTIKEQN